MGQTKATMDKATQKQKLIKQLRQANVSESLKDLGAGTIKTLKNDLLKETSKEFWDQLFGSKQQRKFSGEIQKGESLEVDKVLSGQHEKDNKLKNQLSFERRLAGEETMLLEKKSNELKLQLHAITNEIAAIVRATPKLAQQIEFASIQAPVNPGPYHIIFFENLLELIHSFRKKIEDASHWIYATNKRANKKNFWNQYKVQKGQALLNPETYNSRSAG